LQSADDQEPAVLVARRELSEEALPGMVEAFVPRDRTAYGERDVSFEAIVSQAMRQLERTEAQVSSTPRTQAPRSSSPRNLADPGP